MSSVYENVVAYCRQNGHTIASFERLCGIGNGVVDNWIGGKSDIKISTLMKMQEATGVPVQKWIEGSEVT